MRSLKSKSAASLVRMIVVGTVRVGISLLVTLPANSSLSAFAQQAGSSSPSSSAGSTQAQPSPPPDNNSFPEDLSRKAAKDAAAKKKAEDKQQADNQEDQQPDSSTDGAAASDQKTTPAAAPKDDNAFPEETSRKAADAAKAANSGASPDATGDLPSGTSSSGDYNRRVGGRDAVPANVPMPHLNGKDPLNEDLNVGTYYLQSGNFAGAYQRFKEAATLAPENTDAIFGLAEAARHLRKRDEAIANYQLFLEVVSSGSKARDARKAVASLQKDK